jgi:hypothetical protein
MNQGQLGSNARSESGPLFAQSVHVSRNSLWSLMREELWYCVASLASPNTRNKVAVGLNRYAVRSSVTAVLA